MAAANRAPASTLARLRLTLDLAMSTPVVNGLGRLLLSSGSHEWLAAQRTPGTPGAEPGRAAGLGVVGAGGDCEAGRATGPTMAKFCVNQFGKPGPPGVVRAWLEPQTTFTFTGSGDAPA